METTLTINVLKIFEKFLLDKEASEMFITGIAGTGKTTSLKELLDYCHDNKVEAIACAYTHKACNILRQKLSSSTYICTLHSFLKKRPTINDRALKIEHVETSTQCAEADETTILFIDEFSMVGERDYVDLADLQYDEDGNVKTKVVFIGDPNQLPPVKDMKAIEPNGRYWVKLNTVFRQAHDNPLVDTLLELNAFIEGAEPTQLLEHETLTRNCDIVDLYKGDKNDKVLLAYTNKRVEELNSLIQGYNEPKENDFIFSPTTKQEYVFIDKLDKTDFIINVIGDIVDYSDKYKKLDTLNELKRFGVDFYATETPETGESYIFAAVFGHSSYLLVQQELAEAAVSVNKKIKNKYKVKDPTAWAKANWDNELARERKKVWREYLTFKECVICFDFVHAMTVHKSQGSTFENVYIDIQDLNICRKVDYQMYLKLLYVAISRASKQVFMN